LLKGKVPYIILVVGIALLTYAELTKPKPLDWSPTFSKDDKIPYGAYVLFNLLKDIFPEDALFTKTESVYDDFNEDEENDAIPLAESTNYISISGDSNLNFSKASSGTYIDQYETEVLLDYASNGNQVFIASNIFSHLLSDTLGFETKYFQNFSFNGNSSQNYCYTHNIESQLPAQYFNYVLDSIKNETVEIYATLNEEPVLAKFPFGRGNFYISTTPKLYSNYFLLKEDSLNVNNYQIAEHTFNLLPPQITYWDEHYKFRVEDPMAQKGPLYYVLSVRALKWAMYTALFAMLIFMLFKSKRLQSIIPVVEPEKNLDVDFATTIGTLYYNAGNHADLAQKKITFWKEYVRNRYNIPTKILDEPFKKLLHQKSSIPKVEIDQLVNTANKLNTAKSIDKSHLINFNKMLEQFYQKK